MHNIASLKNQLCTLHFMSFFVKKRLMNKEFSEYKKKLIEVADSSDIVCKLDNSIPFSKYVQMGISLLSHIENVEQTSPLQIERYFILLHRFCSLYTNILSKHRDVGKRFQNHKLQFQQACLKCIDKLERIQENELKRYFMDQQPALPNMESSSTLRTIRINPELVDEFLTYAFENMEKEIEFCGVLCGKLISNQFIVDYCLLPKQTANRDSCQAINEDDLFTYQNDNQLITVGWIHTHPTQTCFLSTVDLRTQYSYQLLLKEAIAIVCSPKFEPSIGAFHFKEPEGMNLFKKMSQKDPSFGKQHNHYEEFSLYESCKYVVWDSKLQYRMIDFR